MAVVGMDVELAGQETDYGVWVRLVVSALGMGRMVAPHAAIESRIRAAWEAALPRSQMEMRGNGGSGRGRSTRKSTAAAVIEPIPQPIPMVNAGGFEFAQLAVPATFAENIRAWCQAQYYEVRIGPSLSPAFRMLTIWRRWQHVVIEEAAG